MKIITLLIGLIAALSVVGLAQSESDTPEKRNAFFKKEITNAKWVLLIKNTDDVPYYIDSLTMNRVMSMVIFLTKSEKRGTITYQKNVGGCTKDIISVTNEMVANPGVKELTGGEIIDPEMTEVPKGSIGYAMLDYVCKNAKVEEVK